MFAPKSIIFFSSTKLLIMNLNPLICEVVYFEELPSILYSIWSWTIPQTSSCWWASLSRTLLTMHLWQSLKKGKIIHKFLKSLRKFINFSSARSFFSLVRYGIHGRYSPNGGCSISFSLLWSFLSPILINFEPVPSLSLFALPSPYCSSK